MFNAFILEDNADEQADASLSNYMVWVQSPAGAWLLLQGGWPSIISARRFVDRTGYNLIDTEVGLKQLDQQMMERQREARPILHLRRVH